MPLTALVGLLVNVAFYGLIFVLSLYFQQVNGLSAFATGLAFVPMLGAVLPANLVAPRVAERIGAPAAIALGAALVGRRMPGAAVHGRRHELSRDLPATARHQRRPRPAGAAVDVDVARQRRARHAGIAAGVLNATRQTGSVLGVALFGSMVSRSAAFIAGLHVALVISAGVLLAAAAVWLGASSQARH